tara:strand:+ start:2631 stop:2924 length:294 start_codon:yes stop_codon:yes gene_type:complete
MVTPEEEVITTYDPKHRRKVADFARKYGGDDNLVSPGAEIGRGLSPVARFLDSLVFAGRLPSVGGSRVRRGSPLRPRGAGKRRSTRGIKRFRISTEA